MTSWDITVFADSFQTFVGNPSEQFLGPVTNREIVRGLSESFGYSLVLFFDPGSTAPPWQVELAGVVLNRGSWTTVLQTNGAVPLPSALLLFGIGLAAVGASRVWRRR